MLLTLQAQVSGSSRMIISCKRPNTPLICLFSTMLDLFAYSTVNHTIVCK